MNIKCNKIKRFLNCYIKSISYKNKDGEYHRENGPAIIKYYSNGMIMTKEYYVNGNLHNDNGPAEINYYDNGNKKLEIYVVNGVEHREDGPSFIKYYRNGKIESENYYTNGFLNRDDGPATIYYSAMKNKKASSYYINGRRIMLSNYEGFTKEEIILMIDEATSINYLFVMKLVINEYFNKDKELLELVDSRIIIEKIKH